jgi:hypothetical protein
LAPHRPDLGRGLKALHDVRVRLHLLAQVEACPPECCRKTKVNFTGEDERLLRELARDTSQPLYRLVAAALLAAVYDQTSPTHGLRQVDIAADKTVTWAADPRAPSPALPAGDPAEPLAPDLNEGPSLDDLVASHTAETLAERLGVTRRAWDEAPCETGDDIMYRAALGRGVRLLEQAITLAARQKRPSPPAPVAPSIAVEPPPAFDILDGL